MAQLANLVQFLDQALEARGYDDSCQNGLQIESSCEEINKVGLAVDSGLSIFEQAVVRNCQMLFVHHGLFWKNSPNLSGTVGKKVRTLIEGGCSLYASHLPLDGHRELGNNAELLRAIGAEVADPFCMCGERPVGFLGNFKDPLPLVEVADRLRSVTTGNRFLSLPFGKPSIATVAVITGSGCSALPEVFQLGVDLFITGEPKQNAYHDAKENRMNVLFAGHYATETFGVKAVGRVLREKFGISTEFIDEPTNI